MKNLENFSKTEAHNESVVSFKKEIVIDELPYQFCLTQHEKPGRYKLDFSVEGTSFLTNKGMGTMNKVFDELISFIMQKKNEGNIKEIYFFPAWELLSLEEVQTAFSKIKTHFEENQKIFNGFSYVDKEGSLYERVMVKDEKLIRELAVHGEALHKKVFDLTQIFKEHDLNKFTDSILDPDYAEVLLNYGNISQFEKEDIQRLLNKQIDWDGKNNEGRKKLYARILERKFPNLKVEQLLDGRSGVLITL